MSILDNGDLYVDLSPERVTNSSAAADVFDNFVLSNDTALTSNSSSIIDVDEFTWPSLFRIAITILSKIGFLLVQVNSVPITNVNLILLQNLVDFCWTTIVFFTIGYVIASTGDGFKLIREAAWIDHESANKEFAIAGWQAITIASSISSCGIIGRTHPVAYIIVGALLTGIIQPFLIHWTRSAKGWMMNGQLMERKVMFKDYAGGFHVHVVGALTGFLGCIVLGRRILRLRELDESSISGAASGSAYAGHFFIFIALQGMCLPIINTDVSKTSYHRLSAIFLNNILAAAMACLVVVLLNAIFRNRDLDHWTMMRCIQAVISGLVTVAPGVDQYSFVVTIALSSIGGAIYYFVSERIFHSALEDNCNIIATHLICGILGSFLAPLCTIKANENWHGILISFAWQVLCILSIVTPITVLMLPLLLLLEACGCLRNRTEVLNHMRSSVAMRRSVMKPRMKRIFGAGKDAVYLQSGSLVTSKLTREIEPRFLKYVREISMIAKVNRENHNECGGNHIELK